MSSGDGYGAPGKTAHEGLEQEEPEEQTPPSKKWLAAVGGLLAVFVLLAGYDLISSGLSSTPATAASARHAATHSATAVPTAAAASAASPAARAAGFAGTPTATASPSVRRSPSPTATPSSSASASAPAAQQLSIAAMAAFGPKGTADGDNPSIVSRINSGSGQAWYSSWYTTPEFGNLQAGTGLLLDMGKPVTVSSMRLALGSQVGADVEVRVGNTASLGLPVAAAATDVGGTVPLTLPTSVTGRYVLVWFTRLPPDGQGHYQISVYGATIDGVTGA